MDFRRETRDATPDTVGTWACRLLSYGSATASALTLLVTLAYGYTNGWQFGGSYGVGAGIAASPALLLTALHLPVSGWIALRSEATGLKRLYALTALFDVCVLLAVEGLAKLPG